ncbi:hypothetical protein V5799_031232 [Amblyomma americanum]|uniref:Uncharacterized protein n=1 Tax=Amblyomma americanum TaxID=6943 RepID=A0AAQ4EKV9_AMBAM
MRETAMAAVVTASLPMRSCRRAAVRARTHSLCKIFAQCVVDGVSGLPDYCEYAGIEETPDFSSSSTALTHGQAAPLLTVAEKPAPTKSDAQVQCTAPVAWKSKQVAFVPKTKSVGVQTGHATQEAESQTDFTVADIMLQEDTAPRCLAPNWNGLSATFEDNPHDSTYQVWTPQQCHRLCCCGDNNMSKYAQHKVV